MREIIILLTRHHNIYYLFSRLLFELYSSSSTTNFRARRMKSGASRLFVLNPDPYDSSSSSHNIRICLFRDVANASELRKELRDGTIDAAMIRAELVRF